MEEQELLETTFATLVIVSRLLDKLEAGKKVDTSNEYLALDKQKLLEAVTAGIASLQKQIDELKQEEA